MLGPLHLFGKHKVAGPGDGKYYLITSGCTGWPPERRARLWPAPAGAVAAARQPGNRAAGGHHLRGRSTCPLPVAGTPAAIIFMADRWPPDNPIDGGYIWLPLDFEGEQPRPHWADRWDLHAFDQRQPAAKAPTK